VLKKTITYEDFNDETVSEDFFFHLTQAELVELELSHKGGLSESMQRIIDAEDNQAIMKEFKNIILSSYGRKSLDGRRFIKNQELRDEFLSSLAYNKLFMELISNSDAASEFLNGIIPKNLAEEVAKLSGATPAALTPVPAPEPEAITRADMMAMSQDELEQFNKRLAAGEVKISE
jgi:hypothetical protein